MARPNPSTWLPLLDRALETEIGIGFAVSGIEREHFRNFLYEARKQTADPKYDQLIMFLPRPFGASSRLARRLRW